MNIVRHLITAFALVAVLCACDEEETTTMGTFDEQEVMDARAAKDEFFRTSDASPIPAAFRDRFEGLSYFAPSEDLVIDATYAPSKNPDTVTMATNVAGDVRRALRMGKLRFAIGNRTCTLTAFREIPDADDGLFVPFKDATTGRESYSGGRYLTVTDVGDSTATIDFNAAYNPYCAYNEDYSCPLVPTENILPVAIRAGERTWK